MKMFLQKFKNRFPNYSQPESFVGLRRMSGVWTWLDGISITYNNWKDDGESDFTAYFESLQYEDGVTTFKFNFVVNYLSNYNLRLLMRLKARNSEV